ncbi:hypothetical protein [Arenimonas oryziterrae]|uniref:Uncharacterized protein n=1 Tax=Arenimonas oryziterrae DSM 21050 = YC6267 TaxID=1121015 RepID=A0A091AT50_9GAMM|nr:hypothetical protein [Arenimonas oryziterrae]KFN42342.1 hypothetical protein N789_14225 [Arenimonas oryziterrae DSM 21050 = YC6267]
MAIRRRNSALKIFTSGKRGESISQLSKRVGRLPSEYEVAQQRAVASLKRKVMPVAKRQVLAVFSLRSSKLTGGLRVESSYQSGSGVVSLWASTRQIPLVEFQGRWDGRNSPGATASILAGSVKVYDHAFIATVQGRRSIRVRKVINGKRAPRGPLRMLRGPSPFEMIAPGDRPGLSGPIAEELLTFYSEELLRQYRLGVKA